MSRKLGGEGVQLPISTIGTESERLREMVSSVRAGLQAREKHLSPKYLYDARGSELFHEITRLEEYYPTRAETTLLEQYAGELVKACAPEEIVELGAGSSLKNQHLLEALHGIGGCIYAPIDVSEDALRVTASHLQTLYPWLKFRGFVGNFEKDLLRIPRHGRRLVCFLGSTIGNMEGTRRIEFLRGVRAMLNEDEAFLMGVDLVKPTERMERAYNDAAGVTARFNKNVLVVLNRELDGDIPLDLFDHHAFYNRTEERIEMHLVAREACSFRLARARLEVGFEAGESLRTEVSCKFHRTKVESQLAQADMLLERWIEAPNGDFGLVLARPAPTAQSTTRS